MDVMKRFLESEIGLQSLYESILDFIWSPHIRSGEFEGNEFIIKKYDQLNFFIFPEYEYPDGHREIHDAISIYRRHLLEQIHKAAREKDFAYRPIHTSMHKEKTSLEAFFVAQVALCGRTVTFHSSCG